MTVSTIMQDKKISKYRLSKNSGIPYSTLTDIMSGKARLNKCSAETVYKLSHELGVTMEELLSPYMEEHCNFELFKSNVCHKLKSLGDIPFVIETLESGEIRKYYDRQWYPECFYLLAMLDYVSRVNDIPICKNYDDIRCKSLSRTVYPSSVIAKSAISEGNNEKEIAVKNAIPEFMRFNIVECEVRNVI